MILLSQYVYVRSVMDILEEDDMEEIQNMMNHFLEHNELFISPRKRWIPEKVIYAPTKEGGCDMVKKGLLSCFKD